MLSYLETLNLFPTPWEINPQDIGTTYPDLANVRMSPLRFSRATPQLPTGTILALVRQLMVVNDELQRVPTSIIQKVQFRVYTHPVKSGYQFDRDGFSSGQLAFELVMRRRDLLAGRSGGFHAVMPDEAEYQRTTEPMGVSHEAHLRGVVVLHTCARRHSLIGIFSVNTYNHFLSGTSQISDSLSAGPQLLPATSIGYQGDATAAWKAWQFDWGLLRGLLEADASLYSSH
jgi:hypothetical protein